MTKTKSDYPMTTAAKHLEAARSAYMSGSDLERFADETNGDIEQDWGGEGRTMIRYQDGSSVSFSGSVVKAEPVANSMPSGDELEMLEHAPDLLTPERLDACAAAYPGVALAETEAL